MAEAILRDMCAKDNELSSNGIEIKSAGTLDYLDGVSATNEAITVMQEKGIDLSSHRAQHINADFLSWADIVLVMTPEHKSYINGEFGDPTNKVFQLTEFVGKRGSVSDPIGLGLEGYRKCANHLMILLTLLKRQIL